MKSKIFHFRYLNPPNYWVECALESRELMALCLKKLKNLSKVKLIDANFVWTEPHSKRLKVSFSSIDIRFFCLKVMNKSILRPEKKYCVEKKMLTDPIFFCLI